MKDKFNLKSVLLFAGLSSAITLAAVVSINLLSGTAFISTDIANDPALVSSKELFDSEVASSTSPTEPVLAINKVMLEPLVATNDVLFGLNLKQIIDTIDVSELTASLGLPNIPDEDTVLLFDNEILIQGDDVAVLRQLIEKIGGLVTHELTIVGGIGVRVTDLQLEILEGLHVFIKPTLNQPIFTSSALDHCLVYGSHVSDLNANKIRWNLYNARDKVANVKQMTFTWPKSLGNVKFVKFNDKIVYMSLLDSQSGVLTLDTDKLLRSAKLDSFEDGNLELTFSHFGTDNYEQRDFSMDLQFEEGCDRSLVKGYDTQAKFNDSNSYYVNNIGADQLHDRGITGKNVTVAVIDSGLWGAHSALNSNTINQPRIKAAYDAIEGRVVKASDITDENSHGTHITGIIANSDAAVIGGQTHSYYQGVAPDVDLVVVKAFHKDGHSTYLDALRGLQYIYDNHEALDIRVLNLSFGAPPRSHYWEDPINQAVMALWERDVVIVTSAGNTGPHAMTIGVPANVPYVISVGAISDNYTQNNKHDDTLLSFSSQGPTHEAFIKPDMVAPGGHIFSLSSKDMYVPSKFPQYMVGDDRFIMSGTSQASGVVSGVVALMLQVDPSLTANDVKCRLMSSTTMAQINGKLAYNPFQQGSGSINAISAVESDKSNCANKGMDIAADLGGEQHYMGAARKDKYG
ncbi:MAG: serine protease AprX, partial [Colwellia sp.]